MDLCHQKNSVLEPQFRKYKGRVVLRGDSVKDDSDITEQGSTASQVTAEKAMDVVAPLPDCDGQAADAISAYTQVKMEDAQKLLKIEKSECPDVWIRLPKHKWPKLWEYIWDPVVPLERNLTDTHSQHSSWKDSSKKALMELGCEKVPNFEWFFVYRKQKLFLSVHVDDIKMAGKKQNLVPLWKKLMKDVDIEEPTSFLHHVYLGCTQRECKPNEKIFGQYNKIFESRISAGATVKLPGWNKPRAKTSAWCSDMEGHARKCVERGCVFGKQKDGATI